MNIWDKAQSVRLQVSESIEPGFNFGFDKNIAPETEKELRSFVNEPMICFKGLLF